MQATAPQPAPESFDPELWAETTTRELLAVVAQHRRLGAEERSEKVEEHLRTRIATVEESHRKRCLRALASQFPLAANGLASDNGHGVNGGGVTPPRPPTAEEWLEGFESVKEGLTPELQKQLVEKMRAAGLIPAPTAAAVGGLPLPASLEGYLPKDAADLARVAQLLDVIFEATRTLDGSFRRVWEGIADFGSTDHGLPRTTLEDVMRKFLAGDPDVPRVVLKTRVETTTKLIPAVLIGVKESWDAMEASVAKCLPEEIQKGVKKSTFGYETNCWKEYLKVAEKLQPDARVKEFFERIVSKARAHIPR